MSTLELTRNIAAPPERIFAFFVPQRMTYWYAAEMGGHFEVANGAPDFWPGLQVRITGRLRSKAVSLNAIVNAYERPRLLEWRFEDEYGASGRERWELEADNGLTRVHFASRYEMPGLIGRLFDGLTRRALQRRHERYLARLARLVERPSLHEA